MLSVLVPLAVMALAPLAMLAVKALVKPVEVVVLDNDMKRVELLVVRRLVLQEVV